mgnify:CR=1 FL=1
MQENGLKIVSGAQEVGVVGAEIVARMAGEGCQFEGEGTEEVGGSLELGEACGVQAGTAGSGGRRSSDFAGRWKRRKGRSHGPEVIEVGGGSVHRFGVALPIAVQRRSRIS